jgi:acetyl esterase/lipase
MSRAFLILLWCSLLALPVFGNANADERGGLIGSDAPAGKRYVYKLSDGTPREMEIFFPPNHDPADPQEIDSRPVAFLWFNPAFSPDDANDPEIDVQRHLAADMPPTLVFFGDKDPWKKGWDAVHAKMRSMEINAVELQLTPGQDHGFFNNEPFQTTTLHAADRFLTRLGLLNGEPTRNFNPIIP